MPRKKAKSKPIRRKSNKLKAVIKGDSILKHIEKIEDEADKVKKIRTKQIKDSSKKRKKES